MKKILKSWWFYLIGFSSLVWFLVRVIPKPSRAAYPCMKAAAPIASSFILYLLSMAGALVAFTKAKKFLADSKYILFSIALLFGVVLSLSSMVNIETKTYALTADGVHVANEPIGFGKGVMPGRVVWAHNPDATNENYYGWQTYYSQYLYTE